MKARVPGYVSAKTKKAIHDELELEWKKLRDLSPNASGGLTRFSPPSELQEIPVATREQSGVLCMHSR